MIPEYVSVLLTDEFGEEVQIKNILALKATTFAKMTETTEGFGQINAILEATKEAVKTPEDYEKIEALPISGLSSFVKNWVAESGMLNE